jgi:hypothetical protein
MQEEGNGLLPKYAIVFHPNNPRLEDLKRAIEIGGSVQFAISVLGFLSTQIIDVLPTGLQYTPSEHVSFCLIKGHVCNIDGSKKRVEGMYHLASRGSGGFDDV